MAAQLGGVRASTHSNPLLSLCRFMQHPKNFGLIASFLDRKVSLPACLAVSSAVLPLLPSLELPADAGHLWVVVAPSPGHGPATPGLPAETGAESAAGREELREV